MLNSLVKLKKDRKRVGRGGDLGGTSGKGHKGQKARSGGYVRPSFEGGQSPLTRRLPKRGFNNKNFRTEYTVLHLNWFDNISLDSNVLDKNVLLQLGFIKNTREKVKLLCNGEITKAFEFHIDKCSKNAQIKVESVGGKIVINK